MGDIGDLSRSFEIASKLLTDFYDNTQNLFYLKEIIQKIAEVFQKKNKILICGNGGSACDAMHFAEEFTGNFRQKRKALPVISLTDIGHLTCVANDFGFEYVFSRAVEALSKSGDLLIVLSTSGNSQNIINAVMYATSNNVITFGLLGKDGGILKSKCDYEIIIPGRTSDRIQELHMLILHIIIEEVEKVLFHKDGIKTLYL